VKSSISGCLSFCVLCLCVLVSVWGQDQEFSGPQVGETVAGFKVNVIYGPGAGEGFDPVKLADGKPLLVIFVHDVTRPSVGLTRIVANYAAKRAADGLQTAVVFLSDDATEMEAWMKRARQALPDKISIGISPDGIEGPGALGLNRKMTMTVLVAKENQVTANFALIQPSLAVDAKKIGAAIAEVLGDKQPPSDKDLGIEPAAEDEVPRFRETVGPVIQKNASPEEVEAAAQVVEKRAETDEAFRLRMGQVARRIIDAGKLPDYGTPKAQEFLQKWAREYGPKQNKELKPEREPERR